MLSSSLHHKSSTKFSPSAFLPLGSYEATNLRHTIPCLTERLSLSSFTSHPNLGLEPPRKKIKRKDSLGSPRPRTHPFSWHSLSIRTDDCASVHLQWHLRFQVWENKVQYDYLLIKQWRRTLDQLIYSRLEFICHLGLWD